MPSGLAYWRMCEENHARPVGRTCRRKQQVGDVVAIADSVPGPAQTSVNATVTASTTAPINPGLWAL